MITYIVTSTIIVSLMGSLFHFMYKFSHCNTLVGWYCPVNESVWEHMKLVFLPMLLWMLGEFSVENPTLLIVSAYMAGIAVGIVVIFFLYYLSWWGESIIYDISIYVVAIAIAHTMSRYNIFNENVGMILLPVFILMFPLLTEYPPHIFVFKDVNIYGARCP